MGDLNDLQQFALVYFLSESDKKEEEREWMRFKLNAIAAHPENAKAVLALDGDAETEDGAYASPLSEEEIEGYVPLSADEIDETLNLFEGFGLRM